MTSQPMTGHVHEGGPVSCIAPRYVSAILVCIGTMYDVHARVVPVLRQCVTLYDH
jgi:hypothetical protein